MPKKADAKGREDMLEQEAAALEQIRQQLDEGKVDEAFSALQRMKESASEELRARDMWRLHELFGACFHDLGDAEGAAQAYFQAAQTDRFLRSQRQHFSSYLFALHYLAQIPDEELAGQSLAYGSLYRDVTPFPERKPKRGGKIRAGYLAPSFREQSAARFYETMLTQYDRDSFEVFCYSMEAPEDGFGRELRARTDQWKVLPEMEPEKAAEMIYGDEVDILFDLGGHSEGGVTLTVMAYHPARRQLSGIGWIDTTGLPGMDFLLGDEALVPEGCHEEFFSETPLRLPHAFCWRPTETMRRTRRVAREGGASVRLGCFNNFMKITDDMLRLWREILGRLPEARLVLQDVSPHPARRREMDRRLAKMGLAGRAEARPASGNYLEELAGQDILLDTFPYTGGGMTAAALYMGTPVITLAGSRYGSRFGMSLLLSAGLPELVARDPRAYVEKTVELARNKERLEELHSTLRHRMEKSALMDGRGYMRELEHAYRSIIN